MTYKQTHRMLCYLRGGLMVAAVCGMFAQMWMLPELMAQELNERERERHIEEYGRELRTYIDQDQPAGERSRQACKLIVERAGAALKAIESGEDPNEAIKDLDRLSEKLSKVRADMAADQAGVRARLESSGVSPVILARHRYLQTQLSQHYNELANQLNEVQRASNGGQTQANRLKGLRSLLAPASDKHPNALETQNPLPRRGAELSAASTTDIDALQPPWRLAAAGDIIQSLLSEISETDEISPPISDDLLASAPEITTADLTAGSLVYELAASLDNDPVKIYEYLRNEVVFEPYWGSTKGARQTLMEEGGNALDAASALIALYRASGIHSRYVFGTIRLTVEEAGEWIGVNDPNQVVKAFSANGVPIDVLETSGGKPSVIEIGHVWVKAHVDYFPYRGEDHDEAADTWIELDPSFKRHVMTGRRDLEYEAGIDPQTLLTNISIGAVSSGGTSVHEMDPNQILDTELEGLDDKFRSLLAAGNLPTESAFRQRAVAEERYGILPVTDDYDLYYRGKTLRNLPDELRNTLSIRLVDSLGNDLLDPDGAGAGGVGPAVASLATLANQRITLSYKPASSDDRTVVNTFGTGGGAIPAGLIALKPELRLDLDGDGTVDVIEVPSSGGKTVMMGQPQWLILEFGTTDGASEQVTQRVVAGGYHAIVLDTQTIAGTQLDETAGSLRAVAGTLIPGTPGSLDGSEPEATQRAMLDDALGQSLHAIGLSYFHQVDRLNQISAGSLDVTSTRLPSFVRVSWEPAITEPVPGIPGDAEHGRVDLEVGRDVYVPISIEKQPATPVGSMSPQAQFLFNAGLTSSVLEYNAVEQALVNTEAYSAARVIVEANRDTTPDDNDIYTFTSTNQSEISTALSGVDSRVVQAITGAVNAGHEVTAPKRPITLSSGSVYGYIVRDTKTGDSNFVVVPDDSSYSNNQSLAAADLIRLAPVAKYLNVVNSTAQWASAVEDATTTTGIAYLPPLTNINDWYTQRDGADPTTTVASVLALSGRISDLTKQPAILNFVAGPQLFTTEYGGTFTVTADALRATQWAFTVAIDDPNPDLVIASTDAGQSPTTVNAIIDASNLASLDGDGTYQYTVTAGNGTAEATTITGSFTLDNTAPSVSIDGASISLPTDIQGALVVEGTADDAHLTDYTLELKNSSGETKHSVTSSDPVVSGVLAVLDTRRFADGVYSLELSAQDALGHAAEPAILTGLVFNNGVDLIEPEVDWVKFHDGNPGSEITSGTHDGAELRIEVSATDVDNTSGQIIAIDVEINGESVGTITSLSGSPGGAYTGSLPLLNTQTLSRGVNTVVARAIDKSGNGSDPDDPNATATITLDGPIHDFVVKPEYLTPNDPVLTVSADIGARQFWTVSFTDNAGGSISTTPPSPLDTVNEYNGSSDTVWVEIDMSEIGLGDWPDDGVYKANIDLAGTTYEEDFNISTTNEPPFARILDPREPDLSNLEDSLPIISDGYFQLRGIADDPDAGDTVSYQIKLFAYDENNNLYEIRDLTPEPTTNDFHTPTGYITGNTGNDILAELDFTGIENGIYELELTVKDIANNTTVVTRRFALAADLKIGNFAFSQQDMTIPTGGVPLSVIRTYNSLNVEGSNDFGPGWSYALGEPDIRLDEGPRVNTKDDLGFDDPVTGSGHLDLRNDDNYHRNVTLTLPDGRRATFVFQLEVDNDHWANQGLGPDFAYKATYISPPGVDATLETLKKEVLVYQISPLEPYWDGPDGGSSLPAHHYDFSGYRLTLEDGTVYTFQRENLGGGVSFDNGTAGFLFVGAAYGELYLDTIETTGGDTIKFDRDDDNRIEFVQYQQPGESTPYKQIYFQRKALNDVRVSAVYSPDKITDPGATPPTLDGAPDYTYTYYEGSGDYRFGQLETVSKLIDDNDTPTDSTDDIYETTKFIYGFADPNETEIYAPSQTELHHYITKIIDARGVAVMESKFDPETGVLTSTQDADGNGIGIDYDIDETEGLRVANINDREGNLTQHFYDDKGNVVKTIDALKRTTTRTYDDDGNTLSETNHLGYTTEFTYDAQGNRTSVKDPLGHVTETDFTYWNGNQVKSQTVTNAEGEVTTSTFDEQGNLVSTTDNEGNTTSNVYDARNRLTKTSQTVFDDTATGGKRTIKTTFDYYDSFASIPSGDAPSDLSVRYPDGGEATAVTTHDESGPVFTQYTLTDSRGNQVESYYKWTDGAGPEPDKFVRSISEYDDAGRVVKTLRRIEPTNTDPPTELELSTTTYNALGKVDTSTDQYGNETKFWYDARGNQVQQKSVSQVDGNGDPTHYQITRTVYDREGRPRFSSDPVTIAATPVSVEVDPIITYASRTHYDPLGRAVKTERLSGVTFTLDLVDTDDADTDPNYAESAVDATGASTRSYTRSKYDAAGRLVESYSLTEDDKEQVTRYDYDKAGRQERTTVPFDDGGGLAHNIVTGFEYDKAGRQLASIDPEGRRTSFLYDGMGRRTRTTFHDGTFTTTEYDGRGLRVAETAQRAPGEAPRTRTFEYDHQGRLVAVILPEVDDGSGANTVRPRTEYTYDIYGNLSSIRDKIAQTGETIDDSNARETLFSYDELHRQTRRALPKADGTADLDLGDTDLVAPYTYELTTYTPEGQVDEVRDRKGNVTKHVYDDLGRLKTKTISNTSADERILTYIYNEDGRLWKIEDYDAINAISNGTTEYTYDDFGAVLTLTTPQGTITYAYDDTTGRKTSVEGSGTTVAYTYDDLGRLHEVKQTERNGQDMTSNPDVTTYAYTDSGSRESIQYPNNVTTTYGYDPASGRLVTVEHRTAPGGSGSQLLKYTYTLDTDGKRKTVAEQEALTTVATIQYDYDSLNRLTQEVSYTPVTGTARDFTHDYTYDLVGNRLSKDDGATVVRYDVADNDLLLHEYVDQAGGTTGVYDDGIDTKRVDYTYDANGSLTRKNNLIDTEDYVYAYNAEDRMKSAQLNGGSVTSYTYNPNGIKVQAGTTNLLIDPNNPTGYAQVFEEKVSGSVTRSYVIGDDVLTQAGTTSSTVNHLLYDGHGSTRALSAHTTPGSLTINYDFDAYGNALFDTASAATSLLYAGEYLAAAAGQYYLRARHYDTANGRFNRVDPFAGNSNDPQSLHKYGYAHSNPVNGSDPSGKSFLLDTLSAGFGQLKMQFSKARGDIFIGRVILGVMLSAISIKLSNTWQEVQIEGTINELERLILHLPANSKGRAQVVQILDIIKTIRDINDLIDPIAITAKFSSALIMPGILAILGRHAAASVISWTAVAIATFNVVKTAVLAVVLMIVLPRIFNVLSKAMNAAGIPICITISALGSFKTLVGIGLGGFFNHGRGAAGFNSIRLPTIVNDARMAIRDANTGATPGSNVALTSLKSSLNSVFGSSITIVNRNCP